MTRPVSVVSKYPAQGGTSLVGQSKACFPLEQKVRTSRSPLQVCPGGPPCYADA